MCLINVIIHSKDNLWDVLEILGLSDGKAVLQEKCLVEVFVQVEGFWTIRNDVGNDPSISSYCAVIFYLGC